MTATGLRSHKELVDWLKSEHGTGHGHAAELVNYHLNPGRWPTYSGGTDRA